MDFLIESIALASIFLIIGVFIIVGTLAIIAVMAEYSNIIRREKQNESK